MDVIAALALALLGLAGAVLSKILTNEVQAWSPWVIERFLRRAVLQLPVSQRARFDEEWRSHIDQTPGLLGKLLVAYSLLRGANAIASELASEHGLSDEFRIDLLTVALKRGYDVSVSLLLLICVLPAFVVSAVLIKLTSRGAIFTRTEYVGKNERVFKLLRFRVVRHNAHSLAIPSNADRRLTSIGAILHKTHVDELPLLFNVLIGDMSLIGPQPMRPLFVERLVKIIPTYASRHRVKPGISGLAQLWAAYDRRLISDAERKLRYDLYYIANCSIALDVVILLRTLLIIFGIPLLIWYFRVWYRFIRRRRARTHS